MDARGLESLALIESMSIDAGVSGIQVDVVGSLRARVLLEPVEERGAVALRAGACIGHEIVYVEMPTPGKALAEAKAGDRESCTSIPNRYKTVTRRLLCPYSTQKLLRSIQVAKLRHRAEAL
jgi:hypothetical protein